MSARSKRRPIAPCGHPKTRHLMACFFPFAECAAASLTSIFVLRATAPKALRLCQISAQFYRLSVINSRNYVGAEHQDQNLRNNTLNYKAIYLNPLLARFVDIQKSRADNTSLLF